MATSKTSTIPRLFLDQVHRAGDQVALRYKKNGAWIAQTWQQVADRVAQTAAVLQHLGIKPGDRVAQLSENRSQWLITDLAIQLSGAIHVPIHTPLTGAQITYQVIDSGARLVLVSNQEQAEKLVAASTDLPSDLNVVSYDPCSQEVAGAEILLLDQLVETVPRDPEDLLAASVQSDSLATILYTSGTTGAPKGVMLTQDNLVSNAAETLESFGQEIGDVRLGFLPLSHIFARTCDLYTWLFGGTELALAESRETVLADCAEIQPMLLNAVPYFYDKLYRSLQDQGLLETPGILRKLLGGRIRSCCSGGAALPNNVFDFFLGQEVPLYQGYGLTEASPVITVSSSEQVKRGSVGKPLKDVEVQLADDGEIITRGPHVMAGYYGNLAATQEVVKDGWLYTGDLGSLDEEGFLFITGRKKEIIVTLGGKNIAPVLLESLLLEDPLIEQVMVIGSERKFLVALIYPGLTALSRELGDATMKPLDASGLATDARVLRLFEERIGDRLADLSPYEQIGQFVLIDRPFSQELNELTPKLSLRRAEVEKNFSQQIEAMYRETRRQ